MVSPPCAHVDRRSAGPPIGRLVGVFALTALFMVVEAVGGWISGSLALLADAGHMLTDVGALGLTLLTAWIARRPASATKTYGYLRWEILASLVNGALLFGIAALVVIEAIGRLRQPAPIQGGLFLVVALAGLVVNGVSLGLLHGHHDGHLNTRGAYLHVLGDLLGSVGAVAAAGIVLLTGWTAADPVVSIVLSLLILVGAWRLVRESTDVLLEAVPRHIALPEVERRMLAVRDGAHLTKLVEPLRHQGQMFANRHAGDVRVDRLELAPILDRRFGLHIERVDIAHAAVGPEQDAVHLARLDTPRLAGRSSRCLRFQELRQR